MTDSSEQWPIVPQHLPSLHNSGTMGVVTLRSFFTLVIEMPVNFCAPSALSGSVAARRNTKRAIASVLPMGADLPICRPGIDLSPRNLVASMQDARLEYSSRASR